MTEEKKDDENAVDNAEYHIGFTPETEVMVLKLRTAGMAALDFANSVLAGASPDSLVRDGPKAAIFKMALEALTAGRQATGAVCCAELDRVELGLRYLSNVRMPEEFEEEDEEDDEEEKWWNQSTSG